MVIRSSQEHWTSYIQRLALALAIVVFGAWPTAAFAQSEPPPKPSGSVNIHQVQVAFIGSGAVGGDTLYFHGHRYPFKLGGLGIGGRGINPFRAAASPWCRGGEIGA
jgi:hypothetical protein